MTTQLQPSTTASNPGGQECSRLEVADSHAHQLGLSPNPESMITSESQSPHMIRLVVGDRRVKACPDKERRLDKVDTDVRRQVNSVCSGESPWPLVLLGSAGCGKTCIGLLLADYYGHIYHTAADWCQRVADATFGRLRSESGYGISAHEVWHDWSDCRLAVLDELGTRERASEHHYETVKRCIDSRECKPAVFISNLDLCAIQEVYDDRISSRLAGGTVITMEGDRRVTGQ